MPPTVAESVRIGQRSRKGCRACRIRRKKCDEVRPACTACVERHDNCAYAGEAQHKTARRPKLASKVVLLPSGPTTIGPKAPLFDHEIFLLHHFRETLADLLCFRPHGATNAFSLHLMPLVQSSSLVLGAVEAISTAHLHVLGSKSLSDAQDVHSGVLRGLSAHICRGTCDGTSAQLGLAVSLLLVYYEVILGGSAECALCHLRGAKAIMDQLSLISATMQSLSSSWLSKIFHYFDVMIALSLRQPPLDTAYCPDAVSNGIDEVFGLTTSLWPTMYRLAHILADHDTALTPHAFGQLANDLMEWRVDTSTAGEFDVNMETTIQIGDAFRFSALLLLHRVKDFAPASDDLQRFYRKALDSVMRTATLDGPMATLVWPLFTVGALSQSVSDRTILRHIFAKLFQRQHMRVVEVASTKVHTMWKGTAPSYTGTVFFA